MGKEKVKIGSFLSERKDRFKPDIANKLGLKRVKKIDFSGIIHLVEHKPTRTNMILVKKGDLLISGINAEKGAVAIYNFDEDAIATIHYSSYVYDPNKIDVNYLKWFLKSNTFKRILLEQAGNGIKSELKPKRFLPLEIELPSLEEQRVILDKIEGVNVEINELQNLAKDNELFIKKLRQSILQDAVRGKLIAEWRKTHQDIEPASQLLKRIKAEKEKLIAEKKIKKEKPLPPIKKEEIPFEIPEGWSWCRLGEIIFLKSGQDLKPNEYSNSKDFGLPYITGASNLKNEKVIINRWTNKPRSIAIKGDLLFTCKGSGVGKMGWLNIDSAHIARQIMAIRTILSSLNYVKILMDINAKKYNDNATGLIPGVDRGTVRKTLIPLPPLQEQKAIVKKVAQLMHYCDSLEEEIKASKTNAGLLMQSVLSELLGEENTFTPTKKDVKTPTREKKYDSKTINMKLQELLKKYGKLHAEDLWKMSEFPQDIDKFYAELKQQIEVEKTIKEVKQDKGYLELA